MRSIWRTTICLAKNLWCDRRDTLLSDRHSFVLCAISAINYVTTLIINLECFQLDSDLFDNVSYLDLMLKKNERDERKKKEALNNLRRLRERHVYLNAEKPTKVIVYFWRSIYRSCRKR